jgi:hypothetical protein
MGKKRHYEFKVPLEESYAKEQVMLRRILDKALTFYADPKNMQAFEAWKLKKEEMKNEAKVNACS